MGKYNALYPIFGRLKCNFPHILDNKTQIEENTSSLDAHVGFTFKDADINYDKIYKVISHNTDKTADILAQHHNTQKHITIKLNEALTFNKTLTTKIIPELIYSAKHTNYNFTLDIITQQSNELYEEQNITLLDLTAYENNSSEDSSDQSSKDSDDSGEDTQDEQHTETSITEHQDVTLDPTENDNEQ